MVPTGIDKEKLMLQLERLEEKISLLKDLEERFENNKDESLLIPAAERIFHTMVEDCININSHLISGLGLKRADNYREIFTRLLESRILSSEIGEKMEEFATFRNRLVHLYWKVEEAEMRSKIKEVHIAKRFGEEIYKYLKQQRYI